jgi:hypothetical protein
MAEEKRGIAALSSEARADIEDARAAERDAGGPFPRDVQPGGDPTMVGTAYQTYAMLDGTRYTADANGVINAQARHVHDLITAGCQFKSSGLPA